MPVCFNEAGAFKDINRNMFPFGVNFFRCTKMSTCRTIAKVASIYSKALLVA